MDRPVWWDEEMAVAAHRTECTLAARSRYWYAVKQYFYKIGKMDTWRYLIASSRWCTASTPHDVTMFHQFGHSSFGGTDWTVYAVVVHWGLALLVHPVLLW
jgi:hypothetical protein